MEDLNLFKHLSIAVIGSGYWGKNLIRNFSQLGVLKLICDKNEDVLLQFKKRYPDVVTCLALDDLLSRKDIDGVAVATPAETHYALAREILLSGKHAYVEKPLALEQAEGEDLVALAGQNKLILMVGHLLQFHPAFICLKNRIAEGGLGKINYICSNRLNLGKIRRDENILWSFAPHDISMILSLADEEPSAVSATGGNYLHNQIADVTISHLDFPSGLKAHIFVSWLHPFKEQKLVVVGDKKMAVFDDMQPWPDKLLFFRHEIKWQNSIPLPTKAESERVDIEEEEPLALQCKHFLTSILTGDMPVTDGREGVRVLKVLRASQMSLENSGEKIYFENMNSLHQMSGMKVPAGDDMVFVHESSVLDDNIAIGRGTKIWHFSHVLPGSRIGEQCHIGQNVCIGPDVTIGNRCKIQNNVSVYSGVTLEDDVFCGPSMVFTNVSHPRAHVPRMDELRQTLVKKGATLGANATIICGVTIGRYAFVGAGAVVTGDVPDHALVIGNPGKQIGWVCECGYHLDEALVCVSCGNSYKNLSGKKRQ